MFRQVPSASEWLSNATEIARKTGSQSASLQARIIQLNDTATIAYISIRIFGSRRRSSGHWLAGCCWCSRILATQMNRLECLLSLQSSKSTFSQRLKEKCISEVVRIGSIIILHLSKLWKANFFILCDVIFLVRLQEKFEIDHCLGRQLFDALRNCVWHS